MVGTRRALLGAGALALLAGCGPPEEAEADPGEVLSEQLRLTRAVADAYVGVAGEGRTNAEARVELLESAVRDAGGNPAATSTSGPRGVAAALAAEGAALRGHVAAIGQLDQRPYRELLVSLVADAAAAESALLAHLDRPPAPTAFPGEPRR